MTSAGRNAITYKIVFSQYPALQSPSFIISQAELARGAIYQIMAISGEGGGGAKHPDKAKAGSSYFGIFSGHLRTQMSHRYKFKW